MNHSGCFSRVLAWAVSAGVALGVTGCSNFFVPKHKVLVDAICAPGVTKPSGLSYRLLAKKSVVSQMPVQVSVVKACVDAALAAQGMFEPPPSVAPDVFIEVGYGTDTTGRIDPAARETFLQLSARDNPEHSPDRPTGVEVWDVRVAVLGIAGRVETAMPLLSSVAVTYMGTDTHMETKIEIPQNDPQISSVRETAIKALETKAAPPAEAPAPASSPETESAPPAGGKKAAEAPTAGGTPRVPAAPPVTATK